MSFQTIDNAIFEAVTSVDVNQKPVQEKKYMFVQDNNPSTTYSTSQIEFTTEILSNNGKYNSFSEGVILLPVVIQVDGTGVGKSDAILALKNSNLNLVHKVNVEYNNTQVVQGVDNLNQYLIFKQHSEMSSEDEKLNGSLLGYAKDSSTTWGYVNAANSEGDGLLNNFVNLSVHPSKNLETMGQIENEGFVKRIGYFSKRTANGKNAILGGTDANMQGNMNYIDNATATRKVYYYNAYIRLRDLPFFKEMPLIRSGTIRIRLTLNNNVQFKVSKTNTGLFSVSDFVNNTSTTNPLMVSASYKSVRIPTVDQAVTAVATADVILGSGCSVIGAQATASEFTIQLRIGRTADAQHPITSCRLYVPHYTLNPYADSEYISNKIRTIEYLDIVHYSFNVVANGQFNQLITNGLNKMRRLIMVGLISSGNGGTGGPAQSSPFTTEPSTTSPFRIDNFNAYVGGVPLYENSTTRYDYEKFLLELNGQQGINANLTQGLVSSRISLEDFNNNYHYIVVNLDRKLPENENTSQSLLVSGQLKCEKPIMFYCFIERYKTISIDVESGAVVA
jgi:hypothetical protein